MKNLKIIFSIVVMITFMSGCNEINQKKVIVGMPTELHDMGVLEEVFNDFEKEYDADIEIINLSTDKIFEMAREGHLDVFISDDINKELEFIIKGYGLYRENLIYDDIVMIGPVNDPASIQDMDIHSAFVEISEIEHPFVSCQKLNPRLKEGSLWAMSFIEPQWDYYYKMSKSMEDSIAFANNNEAYMLTDRLTFLKMKDEIEMDIMIEGDPFLKNLYSMVRVTPVIDENNNGDVSDKLIQYMLLESNQEKLLEFGIEKYGESIFFNALN